MEKVGIIILGFIIYNLESLFCITMSNSGYIITSDNIPVLGRTVTNASTNIICSSGNNLGYTNVNTSNFVGNEFIYTIIGDAYISILKKVDAIKLNNSDSKTIPGSSISYQIKVTNKPIDDAAFDLIVYDKIQNSAVTYYTNNISGDTNFIFEWSTNKNPSQSYNSSNYFTNEVTISIREKIRWIRWKIDTYGINNSTMFLYKVIIK